MNSSQNKKKKNRRGINRRLKRTLRILIPVLIVLFLLRAIVGLFFGGHSKKQEDGRDIIPPEIILEHREDYYVIPGLSYEEEGYRASDDRDGDLTDKVERSQDGDFIIYKVADQAGNVTVRYRKIPLLDPETGKAAVPEDSYDVLVSSRENEDGDAGGPADDPADGSGQDTAEDKDGKPSGKIVHLTFDDGPGEHTQHLLDILNRYGVKATFFVTHAFPMYEDRIGEEAAAGHSIGIHTYSHDFAKIYADDKAFWKDIEKMQEIVVKETGQRTNLMRFAGGSSNTDSAAYTQGIMTLLTKQAEKKGWHYFDWNVSSGDGGNDSTSESVITRITSQIRDHDESVVLCHDTKENTVNAMEYLIPWLLDNGYTLLPLTPDSETAHHAVLN